MGEARPVKDVTADIAARTLKTVFDVVQDWEQEFAEEQGYRLDRENEFDTGYAEAIDDLTQRLREMLADRGIEVPHG